MFNATGAEIIGTQLNITFHKYFTIARGVFHQLYDVYGQEELNCVYKDLNLEFSGGYSEQVRRCAINKNAFFSYNYANLCSTVKYG